MITLDRVARTGQSARIHFSLIVNAEAHESMHRLVGLYLNTDTLRIATDGRHSASTLGPAKMAQCEAYILGYWQAVKDAKDGRNPLLSIV